MNFRAQSFQIAGVFLYSFLATPLFTSAPTTHVTELSWADLAAVAAWSSFVNASLKFGIS